MIFILVTSNRNYKKPSYEDPADIAVLSENFDMLDADIAQLMSDIVPIIPLAKSTFSGNTDWNLAPKGIYTINNMTGANAPLPNGYAHGIFRSTMIPTSDRVSILQEYTPFPAQAYPNPSTYKRVCFDSQWSDWNVYPSQNAFSDIRENVMLGKSALMSNTNGYQNTALGYRALENNKIGYSNTAIGYYTLTNIGSEENWGNVAVGHFVLGNAVGGNANTAIGYNTFDSNINGNNNVAIGSLVFNSNQSGNNNIAIGQWALLENTSGSSNIAIGKDSLGVSKATDSNIAIGEEALDMLEDGNYNIAIGSNACRGNQSTSYNIAIGQNSLKDNKDGSENIGIGCYAGANSRPGRGIGNTCIGNYAGNTEYNNCTAIGFGSELSGDNQVQLGNSNTTVYTYGVVQNRSDERDKIDIKNIELGLEFINALTPRCFRWDYREAYKEHVTEEINEDIEDPETKEIKTTVKKVMKTIEHNKDGSKAGKRFHNGLIAQEVKKVMDTMGVDFAGYQNHSINGGEDILSIGYGELIPILIKAIQEQSVIVNSLKEQVMTLEKLNKKSSK